MDKPNERRKQVQGTVNNNQRQLHGLMQLNFLLLFGILVTWSCIKETHQIPSPFSDQSTCLNDGYSDGSKCHCKNYFDGTNCGTTLCLNEGKNSNNNCKCLPGFLGVHCEPVKCISGDSQTFNTNDKPSVSVLITYNSNFLTKITDDNPITYLCNKNDISTTWMIDGMKFRNWCNIKNEFSPYEYKPLDIADIKRLITNMESNGEAIILSNYALPKNTTPNSINSVLKIAIAKRIRINVIAYAPMDLIDNQQYNDDPGYSALRNLADSTLGSFITPYNGFNNQLTGSANVSTFHCKVHMQSSRNKASELKVINLIIARHNYGTVAVRSAKSRRSVMYNVGKQPYYLAVRTLTTADAAAHIFMKPSNLKIVADTGYWRLYSGQESTGKLTFIMNPNIKKDFNIMLLSKTYLETHAAVSTNDSVDASSPYVLSGSSESILVARIKRDETLLSNETLKTVEPSESISFKADIQNRNDCQFSLALGKISCSGEKAFTITFTAQNFMASTIPFMCVEDPSDTSEVFMDEVSPYIYKSSPKCIGAASLIKNPKRSFIISLRNSKSNNTRLWVRPKPICHQMSMVDNLFVLPGNIFELLVPLEKKNIYASYVANFYKKEFADMIQLVEFCLYLCEMRSPQLFNAFTKIPKDSICAIRMSCTSNIENIKNVFKQSNTSEGFMNKVMNNSHNAVDVNSCGNDTSLSERLRYILKTVKEPYSGLNVFKYYYFFNLKSDLYIYI
uniref:EGF-like domain-containing protein n=1 Tax=Heterorhabditis bacteriophora TaxID=37862 RepID=A0A1I7XEP4_HETBA